MLALQNNQLQVRCERSRGHMSVVCVCERERECMHVCMHACMHVCMYVCMCLCVCLCVCVNLRTCACARATMCVRACACACVSTEALGQMRGRGPVVLQACRSEANPRRASQSPLRGPSSRWAFKGCQPSGCDPRATPKCLWDAIIPSRLSISSRVVIFFSLTEPISTTPPRPDPTPQDRPETDPKRTRNGLRRTRKGRLAG